MAREDDIRKIVSGARARGLGDDQIRALVARYDARQQESAPPPPSVETPAATDAPIEQRLKSATSPNEVKAMALDEINRVAGSSFVSAFVPGAQNVMRGFRRITKGPTPEEVAKGETRTGSVLGGVADIGEGALEFAEPVASLAAPFYVASAPAAAALRGARVLTTSYLAPKLLEGVDIAPGTRQFLGDAATTAAAVAPRVPVREPLIRAAEFTARHATPISMVGGGLSLGSLGSAGGPLGSAGGTSSGVMAGYRYAPTLRRGATQFAQWLRSNQAATPARSALLQQMEKDAPGFDFSKITDPTKRRLAPELLEVAGKTIKSADDWARATELLRQVGVTGLDKVTTYMTHPPTLWGFLGGGGRGRIQ